MLPNLQAQTRRQMYERCERIRMRRLTEVIVRDEDWYVAHCIELGVVSQGRTAEEAQANLKEAVELYLESFGEFDRTDQDGEVKIEGEGSQMFGIRPLFGTNSPLDVESLDLRVTTSEIVEFVKEGRRKHSPRS